MYKMIRTATSTGYRYYTKHGIGPGTLPKDVKLLDWKDLDNNMTEIWLDRFLTTRELNYYDIYPETMNNKLDKIYQSSKSIEYKGNKNDFDDNRYISHDEFVKLLLSRFDFSLEAANIVAKWYENEDVLADYDNPKELLDYISNDIYNMLDAATDEKEYEIVSKYIHDDEEQLDDIDDDRRSENNSWTQQIESAMNQLPSYFNVRGNNLSYDVTYNNRTVHISFYLLEGAKYTYTIDGDGPYTTNQSERIADDIEDYINEKFEDIMSATEEEYDEEELQDIIDELKNKGVSYEIYEDKTDDGCIIFFDETDSVYSSSDYNDDSDLEADWAWEILDTKRVLDSDGFYTDYTLYTNENEDIYICMLGNRHLYGPDIDYADYETDDENAAWEWFDNYKGFADDYVYSSEGLKSSDFSDETFEDEFNIADTNSDYGSDSGIFIEDIIDSLKDNGYDLSRIRSIRKGLLELFGYKGKDADIIIHDLVAGRFIDPNDWVDKDYTSGIYAATNDGEGYWFFTTHGVQPGSVPRDVDILDIIDTPNGSFVKFDRFLSTKELNEYDMVEKAPKSVMSSKESDVRLGDTVEYKGDLYVIIHDESDLLTLRPEDRFVLEDFDDPDGGDSSEDIFLERWQLDKSNCKYVKSSEEDEDDDDLPMVDQEYDSAATSINSNKLPAIYRMVNFNEGDIIVDFGGGKFDNAVEYIKDKGATLVVYDPYNRSAEHNREVLKILRENGGADAAVNSNVLNVIKEPEARKNVLENIARITKPGAPIYITVYEGKGNGQEGPTKSGYQLNRKTADYLEEIQKVFPDATRKGKLITAHNSRVSAAINTANIGAKIACSDVDSDTWMKLAQKKVLDSDGFYTDYTMYSNEDGTSYIFMFGDEDIYGPDPQYADYECSNWDEAAEWWNDYNGFEDDNSLNDIQSSNSTDVTGSISAEEFFTKDDLIEFVISVEDEINRIINPKKKFNVSDAYVDGRNIHIELHNDEYELSGEVSVDMRSIRRPSDIHKYLKPIVDEMINQYNEYKVDDITASAVLDMNPEFRNNFEEAVDFFYEDYPATVELTDEVDEDYDTLYKAYVKEIGSLYQQTPGIVYIDINWDSGEILQALQETAEAIGIEPYPDTIESSEPVEGDTFSQLEDAYLSPPEYDEPTEFDDAEELVEVSLDNNVYVDIDGELYFEEEYLDNNHDYTWASYDNGKDWYSYDYPNIKVDDPSGVAEKIGELLYPNVPSRPGWYHVTGTANLYYKIENVVGYESDYNEGEYEYESDNPDYDDVKSSIANLKVEYIGQSL